MAHRLGVLGRLGLLGRLGWRVARKVGATQLGQLGAAKLGTAQLGHVFVSGHTLARHAVHPVHHGADAAGTVGVGVGLVGIVLERDLELPHEVEAFALGLHVGELGGHGALGGGHIVQVLDLGVRGLGARIGLARVRLQLVLKGGDNLRRLGLGRTRVREASRQALVGRGLAKEVDERQTRVDDGVGSVEAALGVEVRERARKA